MAHCINLNHPDIIKFAQEFDLTKEDVGAVIAVWQEDSDEYDRFPSMEEFKSQLTEDITATINLGNRINALRKLNSLQTVPKQQTVIQDDKSYYRGQIEKPTIDKDGNLVLYGREDELYKRAGLKSYGVSMTDDLQIAIDYGQGQFDGAQLRFNDLWGYDINTWEAEDAYDEMMDNGYWLIQIPKDIPNEIVNNGNEVKVIGNKIIVPKGQYKIEQVAENVEQITSQQVATEEQLTSDINPETTNIASTIYELIPNITEDKIDEIYNNYVSLMSKARKGKEISKESFKILLKSYQVFNYKDTYIFGNYDIENGVFITRVNSSPSSKELLAEALPTLVQQGIDFASFVPEDVANKYKRSGYSVSTQGFDYNFKGEDMVKYLAVSNPNVPLKIFNKSLNELSDTEIENYNNSFELKYNPVEIKGDLIEKAGKDVSKIFETYLSQFGIKVKDINEIKDKLGIDELGFADILSKIAYVKDKKDLPPIAGEFIAYMMQYNPLVSDIIKELSQTKDYKNLDKSEYFKIIGGLISDDLQNKLEGNYSKSLLQKLKELIKEFFSLLNNTPVDLINKNIGIISNNILQQNKKLVTASLYKPGAFGKPTKQVSLQEAMESDKFGASIIDNLSKKGFILTGSTSLGEQGTIQRPNENLLHDIDWISPFSRQETEKLFKETYPEAIKIRDIYGEGYITDTWIIAPNGYKIKDLVKESDYNIITSYDVINNKGEIVGTYRLIKQQNSNQKEEVVTGIEAKVIDFFSYEKYEQLTPFEKNGIKLANWKEIFKAKLQFARYKDIWDYNRFIPNENTSQITPQQPTTSIKKGVEELFNNNPELANQVYEALGFNTLRKKYSQELIPILWSRLSKEGINNADDIIGTQKTIDNVDFNKFWSNVTEKDLLELKQSYEIQKKEQLEDFQKYGSEENKFIPEKGIILSSDTSFFDNKINDLNLILQQKQQALQLYSQYLDTIFPDSKVKDIVYHITYSDEKGNLPFDKFDINLSSTGAIYFLADKNNTSGIGDVKGKPFPFLINITNPDVTPEVDINIKKIRYEGDGVIIRPEYLKGEDLWYAVFEPEQIHILGSKNDIEGFKEFASAQQPITSIKKGVEELFDSNSELAQSVYEALGFKVSDENAKRNLTNQLKNNPLGDYNISFDFEVSDKKQVNSNYETVGVLKDIETLTFQVKIENRLIAFASFWKDTDGLWYANNINVLDENQRRKGIMTYIYDNMSKAGFQLKPSKEQTDKGEAFWSNLNIDKNQITPQQKQQALQIYSQYLDTVFPDSEVKDIVYHGTDKEFDKFKKPSELGSQNRMIAFADDIEYAKIAGSRRTPLKKVISALVNITKIYPVDKLEAMELDSGYRDEVLKGIREEDKVDGLVFESDDDLAKNNFTEILVFEPEQIHILGSQKDIQGFKEFSSTQQQPAIDPTTVYQQLGITFTNDENKPCAANGLTDAVTGTNWKIVKDFAGKPKHSEGGVDITISNDGVYMRKGGKDIKAANGLLIANSTNPEYESMSKVLSQRNRHLNWVKRGLNPDKYPVINNEDGSISTHRLSYVTGDKGEAYIYPTIIQQEDGSLKQLEPDEAWEYAKNTKTAMVVPDVKLADYYSKNGLIKH